MEGNPNGNRNEDLKVGGSEVENEFIETDGTLVNLANGDPNNPSFVAESIQSAIQSISSTGNNSSETSEFNALLQRLNNSNSAEIYKEMKYILKGRNFK